MTVAAQLGQSNSKAVSLPGKGAAGFLAVEPESLQVTMVEGE